LTREVLKQEKKVIVVGAGQWGKNLIRNFYELGALLGVAEMSEGSRSQLEQTYPGLPLYTSLEEALATQADALVIATPAPTHFEFAKAALEANKDVFVEKPMTLTRQDATTLATLADQNKRVLMVGHLLLYQPAIRWIRDYLQSGEAGKVWHVATRRAKLGKVRCEENVWWSFAPHDVSVVLELLGRPTLKHVTAQGHPMLQAGIDDNVNVLLEFTSGQTAHIHSSWYWPINERSTTILAEKKMIVYDEVKQSVTIFDKGVNPDLSNREGVSFVADVADAQPLRLECEHFLHCLETRMKPLSDGWNGVAVVEVLEKAQEAMLEKAEHKKSKHEKDERDGVVHV
jgi:predicted dehydrogenase